MTVTNDIPLNLHDYATAARALLAPVCHDFVAGGAGDEITLRENRAAFGRWRLVPRVMRGAAGVDLTTTVLGQPLAMPVLVAPMGLHQLLHPAGEVASAKATHAAGTIFGLSVAGSVTIDEVAAVTDAWWFQLYLLRDRGLTRDLVARAEAAGAGAIVLTVDVPVRGRREADERHGFTMPDGITMPNLLPRIDPAATLAAPDAPTPAPPSYTALTAWDPAITWADLAWLAGLTRLPVVVKGILAAEDARLAVEHGAKAVIVSNHGGRQLDSAVASLDALPAIAAAIGAEAEVLLDGGIRRGTDALKALALGAKAVLLGRPVLWGLAVDGEAGVARVLELLRAEIALDLTLCGLGSVAEITRALVVPTPPTSRRE